MAIASCLVPQEGGQVQGWESVCWGVGWVLGFLVSWLLGFLVVSKSPGFLMCLLFVLCFKVSWFLSLWFLSFLISKFIGFLDSTFLGFWVPKIQWSQITKISCHVFWKMLIPYSRCSRSFKMDLHDVSVPVFPTLENSWIIWGILVSPKINNIGFEAQGHVRKPRNHDNEGFSVSPMSKSKSY